MFLDYKLFSIILLWKSLQTKYFNFSWKFPTNLGILNNLYRIFRKKFPLIYKAIKATVDQDLYT